MNPKSTVAEIKARFDQDVERFSNLETGQQATIDAPLVLELISEAAATHLRPGAAVLDLGCGAGNLTLSILQKLTPLDCTLVDLSSPMLERAHQRVSKATTGIVQIIQKDMRNLDLPEQSFDAILAGAVLHHLRDDADWENMFNLLFRWLRPGGLLFVSDLVTFDDPAINALMWNRYAEYLESIGGAAYRGKVLNYIEVEDSPRSLKYQLSLLRSVGFQDYEVMHRNSVFAAYYGRK